MISNKFVSLGLAKMFLLSTKPNVAMQNGWRYSKIALLAVGGAQRVMSEKLDDCMRAWDDTASRLALMADRTLNPSLCMSTIGYDDINNNIRYYSVQQPADDILAAGKVKPQDDVTAEEPVSELQEDEAAVDEETAEEVEKRMSREWTEDDTPITEAVLPDGSVGSIPSNLAHEQHLNPPTDDDVSDSEEAANKVTFNPFSPHVREFTDAEKLQGNVGLC